jgi:hypothetical protein
MSWLDIPVMTGVSKIRRTLSVVFVLFYMASSYAVTQERTDLIAGRVRDSASERRQSHLEERASYLVDAFPQYREAKPKAGCDLFFSRPVSLGPLPNISERCFRVDDYAPACTTDLEGFLSRAPPAIQL